MTSSAPAMPRTAPDRPPHRFAAGAAILVALAACVAYANSCGGLFVMDDVSEIEQNPAMHTLLPPWRAMFVGHRMPARPLPYLSFAVDHALWAADPFGYHLTNLAIHAAAAVALFGFVRLTLSSARMHDSSSDRSTLLAAIIAAAWAVHPLQTQAVTYVYQRIESLTGMLCLVAMYCFARTTAAPRGRGWPALCVMATAAAMASKENAVVLPLLIASYDWLFAPEGGATPRSRWRFYACLAATWLVLGGVLVSQATRYGEFQKPVHQPLAYLLTQPRVILHYLRLAAVPTPLCFDYVWRTAETTAEYLPALCWLLIPLTATAYGAVRRRPWSWLGIAFFLTLAPTSSFMPVIALAAEHRMYLPLAAVLAAVVLGGDRLVHRLALRRPLVSRAAIVVACLWIATLAAMTRARNAVYCTPGGIWLDVLAKQPPSTRALWNLAATCVEYGDVESALGYADEAAAINPRLPIYRDLAESLRTAGEFDTATRILQHGLERSRPHLEPGDPVTRAMEALLDDLREARNRRPAAGGGPRQEGGHSRTD